MYIKAQRIIQNYNGTEFCIPFLQNGQFYVLMFNEYMEKARHNISEHLGLGNEYIRPNDNFAYPMMDACFFNSKNKEN